MLPDKVGGFGESVGGNVQPVRIFQELGQNVEIIDCAVF